MLIEQAEAVGEPPEDPLLLFTVLYSFWVANFVAFNGNVMRELATQFLALAEKQGTTAPLMIGHRLMGTSLLLTGEIAKGRAHYDQAIALYDPGEHRRLATRFGYGRPGSNSVLPTWALWLLGYPEAALADADEALKDAHEIGQAGTLMVALFHAPFLLMLCGNYATAEAIVNELVSLAEEKDSSHWRAGGMLSAGLGFGPDRQSLRLNPHARLRDTCMAINGINSISAVVPVTFGECECGTRSVR